MRGDRANYGNAADCKRVTVRLYGSIRQQVERYAEQHGVSLADAICMLIKLTLEGHRG